MAILARLKDAEIADGNIIYAVNHDAELDQLINGHNNHDGRLDNVETNNMTINGSKTFTTYIITNGINERTAAAGVTIDGVVLKDSTIRAALSAPVLTVEGQMAWNMTSNVLQVYNGSSTETVLTSTGAYPPGFKVGFPQYVSTTQVRIPSGYKCRDDSNAVNIDFSSNATIDITTGTGAGVVNALMNGLSEASNTWYYLWAIAKANGADPAGLLTTSSTTIATMPTNYVYKRLVGAFRNDGSSNLMNCWYTGNERYPDVFWDVVQAPGGATVGATNVLDGGTSGTYADVDCSAYIPAISRKAGIRMQHASVASAITFYWRENGVTTTEWGRLQDNDRYASEWFWWGVDSNRVGEYKTSGGSVDISVVAWKWTTEA